MRYFLSGKTDAAGRLRKFPVRHAKFLGENVAVQIDGDYFGEAPLDICESDAMLTVFVARAVES
jgi:diacylglycerol kinase family enzyme